MQTATSTVVEEKTRTKTKYYPRWRVIGLNDDVTPMDYVIMLLIDIFHFQEEKAFQIMMEVHETGAGVFYYGTREACELKIEQVNEMNTSFSQSLVVVMEPIEEDEG